jgi:hypothetical protein
MTTEAPANLMQRQIPLEQGDHAAAALLQELRRSMWSHGDTPFQGASNILHYLCGSQ